jgi:hypothetical protein
VNNFVFAMVGHEKGPPRRGAGDPYNRKMLTAKELIEKLQLMPEDAPVRTHLGWIDKVQLMKRVDNDSAVPVDPGAEGDLYVSLGRHDEPVAATVTYA